MNTTVPVGLWKEFKYASPADAVISSLDVLSKKVQPTTDFEKGYLSPGRKPNDPFNVESGVKALIASGVLGKNPSENTVMLEEFYPVAREIWELDTQKMEDLRKHIVPEAFQWHEKLVSETRDLCSFELTHREDMRAL